MSDFLMPKLGADMSAGTLVSWRKKAGDSVHRGDIMADVETDKGVIAIENFMDGVIEKLLISPGDKVPVGTVLATVREVGQASVGAVSPTVSPAPIAVAPMTPSAPKTPVQETGRIRISPSARDLARTLGIDPAAIRGTGLRGAITREDVEKAASTTPGPISHPNQLTRIRQTIAAAMSRSKREIPHYYLSTTIDMHRAMKWMAEENQRRPVTERLISGAMLIKAVALALREVPELNGVWDAERVVRKDAIHIGVAIALRQGGLIAPGLHDVDRLSLGELMTKLRDLVNRVRSGALRSSELSDPTITVSSLGETGVESLFGVIYPPQVALVGFGKVVERPWVVEGQVAPRLVVTATLSADHRVSDGHRGSLFLAAVDRLLQEPSKL